MCILSCQKNITKIIAILFILSAYSLLFAKEQDPGAKNKEQGIASSLKMQAQAYRDYGLTEQNAGNLDTAMSMYQKALELDPTLAVAYNDIGIIYEAKGWTDRAEQAYLSAIRFNPKLLSAYSNLALLYENKHDLDNAYTFWRKRIALGLSTDPWTQRARKRIDDIIQVSPALRQRAVEKEAIELMTDTAEKKRIERIEALNESERRLKLAEKLYNKGEYENAISEISISLSLDPQNQKTLALLDEVRAKLNEIRKKENIKSLKDYFQNGLRYYENDDPRLAKQEFERIIELTASPQKQ